MAARNPGKKPEKKNGSGTRPAGTRSTIVLRHLHIGGDTAASHSNRRLQVSRIKHGSQWPVIRPASRISSSVGAIVLLGAVKIMARRPKIGDVAEIKPHHGLAYVQYTLDGKDSGEIVRVLPGLYSTRPDLEALVLKRELYFVFYTLAYAIRKREVGIVCNLPVPEWAESEPLMRHVSGRTSQGKITGWRIVPALTPLTVDFMIRTPVLRELTQEQERLSIYHIWPHPVMVKELARGWTPERAESLEDEDRAASLARRADQRVVRLDQ